MCKECVKSGVVIPIENGVLDVFGWREKSFGELEFQRVETAWRRGNLLIKT